MKATFLYVVIGALLVLYVAEKCKGDPEPVVVVPQAVRDSLEELRRTSAMRDSALMAADSIESALRQLAQNEANRARSSERAATVARRGADSLRVILNSATTAVDSMPILVSVVAKQDTAITRLGAALFSTQQQSVALLSQIGLVTAQRDTLRVDRDGWRTMAERESSLLDAAEKRIGELSRKRFPSKTEAFSIGAVVGAALLAFTVK